MDCEEAEKSLKRFPENESALSGRVRAGQRAFLFVEKGSHVSPSPDGRPGNPNFYVGSGLGMP
jgi:hypothetical protein